MGLLFLWAVTKSEALFKYRYKQDKKLRKPLPQQQPQKSTQKDKLPS
jgi:hypothetical protein